MVDFSYESRFGGLDVIRIETMFSKAASPGWEGSLYEDLKAQGLGYRKTVLLEDFRHYVATYQAKTPESSERAERWYQNVYKPIQEETGASAKAMSAKLNSIRTGSIETEEEAAAAGDYAEKYESVFG